MNEQIIDIYEYNGTLMTLLLFPLHTHIHIYQDIKLSKYQNIKISKKTIRHNNNRCCSLLPHNTIPHYTVDYNLYYLKYFIWKEENDNYINTSWNINRKEMVQFFFLFSNCANKRIAFTSPLFALRTRVMSV